MVASNDNPPRRGGSRNSAPKGTLRQIIPTFPKAAQLEKAMPESAAHQVVQYRIEHAVQVEHYSAKVKNFVKGLSVNSRDVLGRSDYYVEGEELKGRQANEEAEYNCEQH